MKIIKRWDQDPEAFFSRELEQEIKSVFTNETLKTKHNQSNGDKAWTSPTQDKGRLARTEEYGHHWGVFKAFGLQPF